MRGLLKLIRLLNYGIGAGLIILALLDSENELLDYQSKFWITLVSFSVFFVIEVFFYFLPTEEEDKEEDHQDILDA